MTVKKISILIIILLLTILIIIILFYKKNIRIINTEESFEFENKEGDNINNSIDFDIIPVSISITKSGNPTRKKNITSSEDKDKLLSFINSIQLKEKLNDSYKGWQYLITIKDDTNEQYYIGILGDKLSSYDNCFYTVDENTPKILNDIYTNLNYPEVNPLN